MANSSTSSAAFPARCSHRRSVDWRHGLIRHHAYAEVPPRVEYELTPLGATLIEPIHVLTKWARANSDAVLDAESEPVSHSD